METASLKTKAAVKGSLSLRGRLLGRLKAVSLLSLPEPDFARFLKEIESDPLFRKLYFPSDGLPRVIRRSPWASTRLSQGFYELKEEISSDSGSVEVESLLAKRRGLVGLIQKVGQEAFERYFLYEEEALSQEKLAQRTGLTLEQVREMQDLVLEMSIHSEFNRPGPSLLSGGLHYTLIAHIEMNAAGAVSFSAASPHLARGRYSINREALEEWQKQEALAKEERKHLRTLLEKIELANIRQNTLMHILETVVENQRRYLVSQKKSDMRPLSMRALARQLSLAPSTISRAAALRSVILPWKEEVPLAGLLPIRRQVLEHVLDEILTDPASRKLPDSALARRLERDFSIAVSRRTVNECRRHLEGQANEAPA